MTFFFHNLIKNRFSRRRKCLKPAAQTHQSSHGVDDDDEQQHQLENEAYYPTIITDLPSHILVDILSRLPLKTILISRCVCKTWRILISDLDFASLHHNRANTELFLRTDFSTCISRTLHWVDLDNVPCYLSGRGGTKINTRFYLPKRGPKLEDKTCKTKGREYEIVNSCNGCLCLRKPLFRNPCIVCNPITGEYVNIPKPQKDEKAFRTVISGFGYSLKSKQYKVLRLVFNNFLSRTAEVYTLGSVSWRKVGNAPWSPVTGLFATYLNGVIHWACDDTEDHSSDFIVGFGFEDERFCVVPAPSHFGEKQKERDNLYNMNLGVLGGCLSICDVTYFTHFDIWVMKDYGVQESWTKQFTVENGSLGLCQPIKYLGNGCVLLFYKRRVLVLYNPVEKSARYLLVHEAQSIIFEAITHVPSFISLKDIIVGDFLEIQNVNSRSAESELHEEAETLLLTEKSKSGESLLEFGFL